MEAIQELLFENKEAIPNGLYVQLMDKLKIAHEQKGLYKITYMKFTISSNVNSDDTIFQQIHNKLDKIYEMIIEVDAKDRPVFAEKIMTKPFKPFTHHNHEGKTRLFDEDTDFAHLRIKHSIKVKKDDDDSDDDDDCGQDYNIEMRSIRVTTYVESRHTYLILSATQI